jgi:hypothetical protein
MSNCPSLSLRALRLTLCLFPCARSREMRRKPNRPYSLSYLRTAFVFKACCFGLILIHSFISSKSSSISCSLQSDIFYTLLAAFPHPLSIRFLSLPSLPLHPSSTLIIHNVSHYDDEQHTPRSSYYSQPTVCHLPTSVYHDITLTNSQYT